jgi:hypothetical protein
MLRARSSFEFGWRAAMGLLLALLASPLMAQTTQAWPEIDTYLNLNSDVRMSFFAASTRENSEGTNAEIGPNIDFYFKPLVKLRKITVFEPELCAEFGVISGSRVTSAPRRFRRFWC